MQDEINQAEWQNPDNWGGAVNLANRTGAISYMLIIAIAILTLVATNLILAGLLLSVTGCTM